MNVLDNFYDTVNSKWKDEDEDYKGLGVIVNFGKILEAIINNM